MLQRIERFINHWIWLTPPLVAGLYLGRLLSELIRPGVLGALLITLITITLCILGLRRREFGSTWPLLFLSLYVVYPDPDLRAAAAAALLTLLIGGLAILLPRWKPSSFDRPVLWIGALLIAAGFLALYLATLSPGLLPADSGEFQLVGSTFGVAHPPGFPLYTILANLMSLLPLADSP
ncbi:MAG: protein O-mannosyl-transferase family, partial [Candidatus Promineifilaceae bacterium]